VSVNEKFEMFFFYVMLLLLLFPFLCVCVSVCFILKISVSCDLHKFTYLSVKSIVRFKHVQHCCSFVVVVVVKKKRKKFAINFEFLSNTNNVSEREMERRKQFT
jgi:hypothetical protein